MTDSDLRDHLHAIQEQLMAVPNKTTHVQAKLDVISNALASANAKRTLRITTSSDEPNVDGERARASRQLLDQLHVDYGPAHDSRDAERGMERNAGIR